MNELALFAGSGGGILGGTLLGWRTVCAVELDSYARRVLLARQRDGHLSRFPIWDDVRTFDGRPWRGHVDVISGGFPCQDISAAGKGAGITGKRSGLWREFARIIGDVGPRHVLVENSPLLTSRGLGTVLGDLASMGFDAQWGVLGARDSGAPHRRDRIWIVANAMCSGNREECANLAKQASSSKASQRRWTWTKSRNSSEDVSYGHGQGLEEREGKSIYYGTQQPPIERDHWWSTEPDLGRVAHGVANRVDRIRALGNGQVPAVVRLAWINLGL